mmetsp:Transcript_63548/g.182483  ORF Transcript_63548/g.182483 Transcript_63548/m.182483 type:complete len:203 (+) Transcript_63548:298-906(+)
MCMDEATARHPTMSSHEPARPSGHACEAKSSTLASRTPTSSTASRRKASSTLSHWSTNPEMQVYMPIMPGRPASRICVWSGDTMRPIATGSVRGYVRPRPPISWRFTPPSMASVGLPVHPSKRLLSLHCTRAKASPAIVTSQSAALEVSNSRPLVHLLLPSSEAWALAASSDRKGLRSTANASTGPSTPASSAGPPSTTGPK